jgi:cysteine desulfurase
MRGGTENIYGIIGLAKALEIAVKDMVAHQNHIKGLKVRMKTSLQEKIPGVTFNGASGDIDNSLYTVLNVCFPPHPDNEMLLFNLDIEGISCSGGSACSSGTNLGSHVLNALKSDPNRANVRFSFSKYSTEEEVDRTVRVLEGLYSAKK